jgi:hypothetical protein
MMEEKNHLRTALDENLTAAAAAFQIENFKPYEETYILQNAKYMQIPFKTKP